MKSALEPILYAYARAAKHILSNDGGIKFYKFIIKKPFVDHGGSFLDAVASVIVVLGSIGAGVVALITFFHQPSEIDAELEPFNATVSCIRNTCSYQDCITLFAKRFPASPRLKTLENEANLVIPPQYCNHVTSPEPAPAPVPDPPKREPTPAPEPAPSEKKGMAIYVDLASVGFLESDKFKEIIASVLDQKNIRTVQYKNEASAIINIEVNDKGVPYQYIMGECPNKTTMYRSCPKVVFWAYSAKDGRPLIAKEPVKRCRASCELNIADINAHNDAFKEVIEYISGRIAEAVIADGQ